MVKTKIAATAPKHILTIMDDDVEVAEARKTEIWNKVKQDVVLKGFRKGKVPRGHAENTIGYDNLYEDYVREVVHKGMLESGESIVGVGQVIIDILEENKPTVLRVEVWVEPTVRLEGPSGTKTWEGLEVSLDPVEIEDAEVDAVFQRMREATATTKSVEREAGEGDAVVIDFEGKLVETGELFQGGAATDYQVIIGAGILLPDFESQLPGVKTGETKEINLTFPSSYPNKDLANKEAVFAVTIKDVQERTLPELDDEFAKQMGYESIADGHAKVVADLTANKEQQQKAQAEQQLLNGLITSVQIDPIPGVMIKNQAENNVQQMLQGVGMTLEQYLKKTKTTEDQLLNRFQQQAATDVRARLILKAIAETEKLEATAEEQEEALKLVQPQFGDMDLETLRTQIDMDSLTLNLRVQKAMDLVREKSVPKKVGPTAPVAEPVEEVAEVASNG